MLTTSKIFITVSGFFGLTATILGAFGAHRLKGEISEPLMHAYQTAVQYQFYHTFALALAALLIAQFGVSRLFLASGVLFISGIILFSGSLYGLALSGLKWLGPITPLGGLCFILGWVFLVAGIWKS